MSFTFPAPRKKPQVQQQDKTAALAYSVMTNCYPVRVDTNPVNDTPTVGVAIAVAKVQGHTNEDISSVYAPDAGQVTGGGKGMVVYRHPNPERTDRSQTIFALGGCLFIRINGVTTLFRDIEANDSRTVKRLTGAQQGPNLFLSVGSGTQLYEYLGVNNIVDVLTVSDGATEIEKIIDTDGDHNMEVGEVIILTGSAGNCGEYVITSKTDTQVTATRKTEIEDGGDFQIEGPPKLGAPVATPSSVPAASIVSVMPNRLLVSGAGDQSYIATYSDLSVIANYQTFTPSNAIDGPGRLSGIDGTITAAGDYKGITFVSQIDRITFHDVGEPIDIGDQTGNFLKPEKTILSQFTQQGIGIVSQSAWDIDDDKLYFCDKNKGIFSLALADIFAGRKGKKNLIDGWADIFFDRFSLDNATLAIHRTFGLLLVGVATEKGSPNNKTLVYNLKDGGGFGVMDKAPSDLQWDFIEQKMWGLSSALPEFMDIFDGGFMDNGEPISMVAETRMYEGGRSNEEKEYDESSVSVGSNSGSTSVTYSVIRNGNRVPDFSETFILENLSDSSEVAPDGEMGAFVPGRGRQNIPESIYFKQFLEDRGIVNDGRNFAIRIEESSARPFYALPPLIKMGLTGEQSDEI